MTCNFFLVSCLSCQHNWELNVYTYFCICFYISYKDVLNVVILSMLNLLCLSLNSLFILYLFY